MPQDAVFERVYTLDGMLVAIVRWEKPRIVLFNELPSGRGIPDVNRKVFLVVVLAVLRCIGSDVRNFCAIRTNLVEVFKPYLCSFIMDQLVFEFGRWKLRRSVPQAIVPPIGSTYEVDRRRNAKSWIVQGIRRVVIFEL